MLISGFLAGSLFSVPDGLVQSGTHKEHLDSVVPVGVPVGDPAALQAACVLPLKAQPLVLKRKQKCLVKIVATAGGCYALHIA